MKNLLFALTMLSCFFVGCQETENFTPQIESPENHVTVTNIFSEKETVIKEYDSCDKYFAARCAGFDTPQECASFKLQYTCSDDKGFVVLTDNWGISATIAEVEKELTITIEIDFEGESNPYFNSLDWVIEDNIIFRTLEQTAGNAQYARYTTVISMDEMKEGEFKLAHKGYVLARLNFTIKDDLIMG